MCYIEEKKYVVRPKESYKIIRNCQGCGTKSEYINTKRFRVNANGNKVDVWLIYQCEACKHTYNLSIYERLKPGMIDKNAYQKFLNNDKELAYEYGVDKTVLSKNKAQILEFEIEFIWDEIKDFEQKNSMESDWDKKQKLRLAEQQKVKTDEKIIKYEIENPYACKIRTDKAISVLCEYSRSQIQKMQIEGTIEFSSNHLGKITNIKIRKEKKV